MSPGAVIGDFNLVSPKTSQGIETWGDEGNSNPGIVSTIYGIKWNANNDYISTGNPDADSGIYTFTFTTYRQPVWGDFYAKDGQDSYAMNCGHYIKLEPGQTANGIEWNKYMFIPVPDSKVPLPPSLLFLGSGLLGLGLLGRRQRRKGGTGH